MGRASALVARDTTRRDAEMATQDGSGTGTATEIRAEVDAVIETAGKAAHEGLDPAADSVRVLAGLVLQLAEQVRRLLDEPDGSSKSVDRSPNETDSPTEEDASPEDSPAEPARPV
jgi:hypothetical protein